MAQEARRFRFISKIAQALAITVAVLAGLELVKIAQADPQSPTPKPKAISAVAHDLAPQAKAKKKVKSHSSIWYKNEQYGFRVRLPKSWTGYKITTTEWDGSYQDYEKPHEEGPVIHINHPKSTDADPRQDIPIMIFTLKQWEQVDAENMVVSAAPFGPGELARNDRYVFALPPRYNYAFAEGYEEVNEILAADAVQPR